MKDPKSYQSRISRVPQPWARGTGNSSPKKGHWSLKNEPELAEWGEGGGARHSRGRNTGKGLVWPWECV